jgi:hemolysin activation/secretion protein
VREDDTLHRHHQERLLEEQRQRLQELQRRPAVEAPAPGPAQTDPNCFPIKRIEVEGAQRLAETTRARLLAPFTGRCLAASDIDAALRALTGHYLERGYVTTRAYLPAQELSSGTLKITVIEGVLEALQPAPGSGLEQRELEMAFPGRPGGLLNLREIEQLLDQLNRLPARQSRVELEPGKAPGASRVRIHRTPPDHDKDWRLRLSRHNNGDDSTGEHMLEAGLEWDTPLGLADQLTLRLGQGLHRSSHHGARNLGLGYSLPWGWWNAAYHFYYSDYASGFDNGSFFLQTSGRSRVHDLRLERVLHRDERGKTGVNLTLNHTAADNYIEDIRLDVSSPRLTEIGLGINHGRRLGSAILNLDLGWQRGTPLLGATRDHHPGADDAHAQYDKYTLSASLLHPFTLFAQALNLESIATWQKSEDVLTSQRRMSPGGLNAVRGYKEQTLMGDTGGYWRTQLNWDHALSWSWSQPVFQHLRVGLGWDIGAIERDRANRRTGQHGILSGHALEIALRGPYARASLTLARADRRPRAFHKSEAPFWFRLELSH